MTILKEYTNSKHREVEALPMIQCIMKGPSVEQYVYYLYELKEIYRVLESHANQKGILNGLDGIERYQNLVNDIDELHLNYSRSLHNETLQYFNYLDNLVLINSKMLLAHVYVRHMGDLYGGKLMARVVPGSGTAYNFSNRPELIKAFNNKLTLDLANEANVAFDFFIRIFKSMWNKIKDNNENSKKD